MIKHLKSIKQIIDNDFSFVAYSLDSNFIDAPDGDYQLICRSYNYHKNGNKFLDFYSDSKVHVRSNLIETGSLLKAAGEIREKTGYHGVFLEIAELNKNGLREKRNYINIHFGS